MSIRRLLTYLFLASVVHNEERSILDGATMLSRDLSMAYTLGPNAVCDGGFKSRFLSTQIDVSGGMNHKEVVIALTEAKQVKTAFL